MENTMNQVEILHENDTTLAGVTVPSGTSADVPTKIVNALPTKSGNVSFSVDGKYAKPAAIRKLFDEWYSALEAGKPAPYVLKFDAKILRWLTRNYDVKTARTILANAYIFDGVVDNQVIACRSIKGVNKSGKPVYGDIVFKAVAEINDADEGVQYTALYSKAVRPSNDVDAEEWLDKKDAANRAAVVPDEAPSAPQTEFLNMADRFEAIQYVESRTAAFFVNGDITRSTLTIGQVTALNSKNEVMTLADEYLEVADRSGNVLMHIEFDVPESAMIAAIEKVTDIGIAQGEFPETFEVTGTSGAVYTYSEKTLEVISVAKVEKAEVTQAVEVPVEKPALNAETQAHVDKLVALRDAKQAEIAEVENAGGLGGLIKAAIKRAQLDKINAEIDRLVAA